MDDFEALTEYVMKLERKLDRHMVDTSNMLRVGPVAERDHEKGVRVEHGTEKDPDKSAWVQPAERSGVERDLPRKGEQLMVLAPYGDSLQGITIPLGHSDEKKNPAGDADEVVIFNRDGYKISMKDKVVTHSIGKTKLTIKDGEFSHEVDGVKHVTTKDGITRTVGGVTEKLTSAGCDTTGGKLIHDKRNVGSGHVHSGVVTGAAKTQQPDE